MTKKSLQKLAEYLNENSNANTYTVSTVDGGFCILCYLHGNYDVEIFPSLWDYRVKDHKYETVLWYKYPSCAARGFSFRTLIPHVICNVGNIEEVVNLYKETIKAVNYKPDQVRQEFFKQLDVSTITI